MRRPIVAGNWKMNCTTPAALELARGVERGTAGVEGVEVVLCPAFPVLKAVGDLISRSAIELGAQNVHWEPSGAHTGEVSIPMLQELGCRYVILGHSERRAQFHETDRDVNLKCRAVLDAGLTPIVCVGETLDERQADRTMQVVRGQLEGGLHELGTRVGSTIIAYEPVWAIGTGHTATPEQAQEVHRFIRDTLGAIAGERVAREVRIQYGGSVKPGNAAELFGQPDVDGGLVGGASLDADSFVSIVKAAA